MEEDADGQLLFYIYEKKVHLFINAKTLYGIPKIWKFLRYLIFANPSNKAMD